jgi:hypothetical protein
MRLFTSSSGKAQKINLLTPTQMGANLISFAPLRDGVNEENQFAFIGKQAPNQFTLLSFCL